MNVDTVGRSEHRSSERLRGVAVVLGGTAVLAALAYGGMLVLTSPDSWMMKAATQVVSTAQQGTLASYDVSEIR